MDPLPHVYAKSARGDRPAETVTDHLAAALRAGVELRARTGRIALVERVFDGRFWDAVLLAVLSHDAGKVADGFQRMVTGRTGSWGQRHELLSLGFLPGLIPDPGLRRWVAAAVVTHHRPLTDAPDSIRSHYGEIEPADLVDRIGPVEPGQSGVLAAWLAATARTEGLPVAEPAEESGGEPVGGPELVRLAHTILHELLDEWDLPVDDGDRGLAAVLLQGAVTTADHLSSAHGTLHTDQPVGPGFETRLAARLPTLHDHQLRAGKVSGHLLLRAPTGSGKTEAGLLWAAAQVADVRSATGAVPRVFVTLPYLASINAMAERLADLLGDPTAVGVAHSRAASYHLTTGVRAEDGTGRIDAADKAVARAAATRLFRETVRVATPYQLLRGVLAGAAHSGILLDTANSVFVLDELHAYETRRLGFILAMARLWVRIGGRVAVLSATLPRALADLVRGVLAEEVTTVDGYSADTASRPRHRLRVRERRLTADDTVEEIRQRLAQQEAVLVVANTVADAQALFDTLGPVAEELCGPNAAALLHSRFRRRDRSRIERRITGRYGPGGDRRAGLVVATQVVEVSLDVDFDVLFTSAAPLEALLQRFGRVNRRGDRPPADVLVHEPEYRTRGRSGEYADGIYPAAPVAAGWRILTRHHDRVVDEAQATDWLDEVYGTEWGQQWRAEVRRHQVEFEEHFLSFDYPYGSRETFSDTFDEMFDGTEAILAEDREAYQQALHSDVRPGDGGDRPGRAVGRLLAEEYLIPLPHWAGALATYDRRLRVRLVEGEYDPERGLHRLRTVDSQPVYRPGEVL